MPPWPSVGKGGWGRGVYGRKGGRGCQSHLLYFSVITNYELHDGCFIFRTIMSLFIERRKSLILTINSVLFYSSILKVNIIIWPPMGKTLIGSGALAFDLCELECQLIRSQRQLTLWPHMLVSFNPLSNFCFCLVFRRFSEGGWGGGISSFCIL